MVVWLGIGAVLAALAVTLPLRWAAAIVVLCLPLNGTAVAMLGADPVILPLVVTAGFLLRHAFTLFNGPLRAQFLDLARADILLVAFAAYCVLSGLLFPRLFAGETEIYPQEFVISPVVLGPERSSIPQIAYLLFAVWLMMALRQAALRNGLESIVIAILVQIGFIGGFACVQAGLGLGGVRVPTNWIVNNEGYALLNQVSEHGFVRITSVFVESSAFGAWGAGSLAFCYALFVNRILPKVSLAFAAVLAGTMLLSTASTAYIGLAIVTGFALTHIVLDADRKRRERALFIAAVAAFGGSLALIFVFSASGGFLAEFRTMIENTTVNKTTSWSAIERGLWVKQAITNGLETGLLGVGYGALRSSGVFYTLFGGVGAPGVALFLGAMAPLMFRAFRRPRTGEEAVASAGGFALLCSLGALAVSGADTGLTQMFWVYAAVAAAPVAQRAANRLARQRFEENTTPVETGEQPTPS